MPSFHPYDPGPPSEPGDVPHESGECVPPPGEPKPRGGSGDHPSSTDDPPAGTGEQDAAAMPLDPSAEPLDGADQVVWRLAYRLFTDHGVHPDSFCFVCREYWPCTARLMAARGLAYAKRGGSNTSNSGTRY